LSPKRTKGNSGVSFPSPSISRSSCFVALCEYAAFCTARRLRAMAPMQARACLRRPPPGARQRRAQKPRVRVHSPQPRRMGAGFCLVCLVSLVAQCVPALILCGWGGRVPSFRQTAWRPSQVRDVAVRTATLVQLRYATHHVIFLRPPNAWKYMRLLTPARPRRPCAGAAHHEHRRGGPEEFAAHGCDAGASSQEGAQPDE